MEYTTQIKICSWETLANKFLGCLHANGCTVFSVSHFEGDRVLITYGLPKGVDLNC